MTTATAAFWDKRARSYAARPISNPENYEDTLTRTRAHLTPGMDVIELGCGTGSTALRLADAVGQYTGTDYSREMIEIARAKLGEDAPSNLGFDIAALGRRDFDGCSYDAVLAFNLLHLIEDVPAALAEIRRMMPKGAVFVSKSAAIGGKLPLRVMIGALRLVRVAPPVSFFRAATLEDWMRAAGFEIVETKTYPGFAPTHFVVARAV